MSFESGKNQGLASSIITVVAPLVYVLALIIYVASIVSIIIASGITNISSTIAQMSPAATVASLILSAISIVSSILFYSSLTQLGKHYQNPQMAKNVQRGFIFAIISSAISISSTFIPSSVLLIGNGFINLSTFFSVLNWIILSVTGYYYMQAFNGLAKNSQENKFKTSGLMVFIGNLTSAIGIGGLLTWIGWIFAISGFYKLKPTPNVANQIYSTPTYSSSSPIQNSQQQMAKKFCNHCGAENTQAATYCARCGNRITPS